MKWNGYYDTAKDFQPVSLTAILPLLLAVHPSVKANNVQALITLARSSAKPLNYASGGIGSSQHLAGELINTLAGIKMTQVPYKGGGPRLVDLLAGQVNVMASTILSIAWYGLVAPAGMPPAVLAKLSAEVIKGTKSKETCRTCSSNKARNRWATGRRNSPRLSDPKPPSTRAWCARQASRQNRYQIVTICFY